MNEPGMVLLYLGWLIVILVVVVVVSLRRVKAMKAAAQKAGLSGIRANLIGRVSGSWRGYAVTLRMFGGGRSGPERAVVEIRASTPARLIIHRRTKFDINFSPFSPPVVRTAFDGDFVVRSDDAMLAERLLGDAKVIEEMRAGLLQRMDRLEIDASHVRATRVTRPLTRDEAIREAWKLASIAVEQLGLPPATMSA
jgi:hypothetical protein